MKKYLAQIFLSALSVAAASSYASETEIASSTNLQNCRWTFIYTAAYNNGRVDGLFCTDFVAGRTNMVLERNTSSGGCSIGAPAVGYTLGGLTPGYICNSFRVYKINVTPVKTVRALSGSSVSLSWTSSPEANRYEVYRNNTLLTKISGYSYSDSAATPGQTNSYSVRACLGENCSAKTFNEISAFIPSSAPQVFTLPKKDGLILGADHSPVPNTTYFAGDTVQYILDSTANQFCVEQGYLGFTGYSTQSNYGYGHKFNARGGWYSYGGGPFTQITSVTCAK